MVGAILEGALYMGEDSEFPIGMYMGILTVVGLLVSLIISKVFPTPLLSHRVLPAKFASSINLPPIFFVYLDSTVGIGPCTKLIAGNVGRQGSVSKTRGLGSLRVFPAIKVFQQCLLVYEDLGPNAANRVLNA